MRNKRFQPCELTRRQAVLTLLATVALPVFEAGANTVSDIGFAETVAKYVRNLTKGDPQQLRILLPETASANMSPVTDKFLAMTGVDVVLAEAPITAINTELSLNALMGDQSFDLALPATFGLPDLVAADALYPLTALAKKYEPSYYRDHILYESGNSSDGDAYGFETGSAAYLMFYNRQMLESTEEQKRYKGEYGTPLSIPTTWQELDRQIKFFNRPDDDQWGGLLFRTPNYLGTEWWVRLHAKGVLPFSPDMTPQIDSDGAVEALEEMIKVTKDLHPDVVHLNVFENWEKYSKGNIYCNIGRGGLQKYLNRPEAISHNNMLFGPTPDGMVNGELVTVPYFNWGWDNVVVKSSKNPELAYLFALFASTPEMSTLAVRQQGDFFDPYLPEHYEDPEVVSVYSPEFLKVHREILKNMIPRLYLEKQAEYFHSLTGGLMAAMYGDVSPKKALKHVTDKWELITESAGREQQARRWALFRRNYLLRR